ncbi:hypothetical protein ACFQ9V_08765 [Leifsonia sp. NPDC056665]|uniref:hypothetical protein n=1 Tax=Leifsonia sp. NPDC056665 TaxID=3345901 RepID=UPI00369FB19E
MRNRVQSTDAPRGLPILGPVISEKAMIARLGVKTEELKGFVADRRALRIFLTDGRSVFPTCQLDDQSALLTGLDMVLGELGEGVDDPYTWWGWLLSHPKSGDGRSALELLRDGEFDAVVRAAGRSAWAWRA